ncbi:MAG: hypothetical protein KDE54_36785 [Caldilineaceae bacterium]|nr:hypothetical protein [Caldilineaceae bacterium]MCB0142507.1 hypothetical protein [Caldilineaceae bacterium]
MNYKLDDEEKEILEAFAAGNLEAASNANEQIFEAQVIAWHTLNWTNGTKLLVAINEAYDDFPDEEERVVHQEMLKPFRQCIKDEFLDDDGDYSNA